MSIFLLIVKIVHSLNAVLFYFMDPQGEKSKWNDDFNITKFLEILLKFRNEQNDRDVDISNTERRLPEYFLEFQEGLTAYDIKLGVRNIRELYKKEALKLLKAGKRQNESKLPWFSLAENLFSHTVNWDKEIERVRNIKSSNGSSERTSDDILANFRGEERKLSPLPPMNMLFYPENIVSSTFATTSVLPNTTPSLTYTATPLLAANSKPHVHRDFSLAAATFPRSSSVLPVAKSLASTSNRRRKSAKFLTIGSPFVMNSDSSRIDHPFSPPSSPASRIPLRLTKTSSNISLSNTVFTSAENRPPPDFISAANKANPSPTTASLTHSSSTSPWADFPPSLTVTSCAYRTPCSTKVTYSSYKDPVFITMPPRAPFSHTPYKPEVPLLQVVSPSKSRIPIPKNTQCSSANIFTFDTPSSNAKNLCKYKHPPPYRTNVHPPSAAISKSNVIMSTASSSKGNFHKSTASSRSSALTSTSLSSRDNVFKTDASSSLEGFRISPSKYHLGYRQKAPQPATVSPSWFRLSPFLNSSSSEAGAVASTVPASNASDLSPVSTNTSAFRSSILTPPSSISRDNVSESTASSRYSALASSSSRDEVLKTTVPSSWKEFHILPSKPHLVHKQRAPLSSTISASRFRVPISKNLSSTVNILTSPPSSSSNNVSESTARFENLSLTMTSSLNRRNTPSMNASNSNVDAPRTTSTTKISLPILKIEKLI